MPPGDKVISRTAARKDGKGRGRGLHLQLRSIRGRLLFMLLVLALTPMVLTGFLSGYYGKRLLQQSIGSNFQKVARAVVSSVDQAIEQRRQAVADMAVFPSVQELAARGRPGSLRGSDSMVGLGVSGRETAWDEDPASREELSRMFRNLSETSPDLTGMVLTDADGWVVAASAPPEALDRAGETWWFRARSGGCRRSYVDDLEFDAGIGDQVAAVTVPVCRDDEMLGVLRTKLSLGRILHMVSALDLEDISQVWIINNNGAMVAAVDDMKLIRVNSESAKPAADVARSIVGSRNGYLESTMAGVPSVIGFASSTGAGQFRGLGWIVLVVEPASGAYRAISRFQYLLGLISAVMVVLVVLVGLRSSSTLTAPIRRSTAVAQAVAQGNLTSTLAYSGQEELDSLADGLNGMTANLRRMVGSIRRAARDVNTTSRSLADSTARVLSGSRDQISRVDETTKLMQQTEVAREQVSSSLSAMVVATDECSDSIHEMDANISEIVNSTESLAGLTDTTLASVEQMVVSIKQVDRSAENLKVLTATTTAAVAGMEGSIERIDSAAIRTSEATERDAELAEAGEGAVERTIIGIGEIETAAGSTAKAIHHLAGQVGKIGGILSIIKDVTEQTNLLALNASILAAQAGEHGGGFAVVATEIKELAERTARSTKEIAGLIGTVQAGAQKAGTAMAEGMRHVNDGVARSREAGEALRQILDGTKQSARMTQEIVDAVAEHAAQSRTTTAVIKRLNDTVTRIAAVTQEQANGCASILNASEQMREQTALVRRAILEQKEGSRCISESVGRVTHVAKEIDLAGEEQRHLSRSVVDAMERIGALSHEHVSSLVEIHDGVRALTEGAAELRKQVSLFGDDQDPADKTPEVEAAELLE